MEGYRQRVYKSRITIKIFSGPCSHYLHYTTFLGFVNKKTEKMRNFFYFVSFTLNLPVLSVTIKLYE